MHLETACPGHRRRRLSRLAPLRAAARRRATRCSASTTSSPARRRNIAAPARPPRFELMRHDVTFPLYRRGRRDLQPGLPGLADPLPVRSGADDQDQRARRHQHAGPGQARAGQDLPGLDLARSTAIPTSTRSPRTTGATSIRSARAPATTRASAAPRRCSSTTTASTGCEIKVARIFNTYGPRMHPNDGRVVSNFIVQALQGEPITIYGDGTQTRSFCYVDDLIDGFVRLMDTPRRASPARSTSAIPASSPSASWPSGHRADRLALEDRAPAAAAGRSAAAPARHRAGQGSARLGADACSSSEGLREDDRLFRRDDRRGPGPEGDGTDLRPRRSQPSFLRACQSFNR